MEYRIRKKNDEAALAEWSRNTPPRRRAGFKPLHPHREAPNDRGILAYGLYPRSTSDFLGVQWLRGLLGPQGRISLTKRWGYLLRLQKKKKIALYSLVPQAECSDLVPLYIANSSTCLSIWCLPFPMPKHVSIANWFQIRTINVECMASTINTTCTAHSARVSTYVFLPKYQQIPSYVAGDY